MAARALRGTRQHQLQELRDAARERKRVQRRKEFTAKQNDRQVAGKPLLKQPAWWDSNPQLTGAEKTALDSRLRPITLLDHLFRLRIQANYEDALMFSQGPENEWAATTWAANLVAITSASLLVHELRLTHLLGSQFMRKVADDWLKRHHSTVPSGLILRRPAMWA